MAARVCAWCGISLDDPPGPVHPAGLRTHGLCVPCLKRVRHACGRVVAETAGEAEEDATQEEPAKTDRDG